MAETIAVAGHCDAGRDRHDNTAVFRHSTLPLSVIYTRQCSGQKETSLQRGKTAPANVRSDHK
jgi:hypothetical protein